VRTFERIGADIIVLKLNYSSFQELRKNAGPMARRFLVD
jgi:hypothetical protein